ncbi:MAG: ABC transporter ATP-binding protein [Proteobacteria bacterium]|nr:ABC transporter ATP-binding protein [Pseudomonadota bacterium]MBU1686612.1 ABC transporter ATP-binding protein [Pseudomonadota bacterium]
MIIECKNLMKVYQTEGKDFRAVDDVSMKVEKGEFVIILGHSGSGKTTLLSLIGGLARPDAGAVIIHGLDQNRQAESELAELRNRTIGFIFQFSSLIPTLTALENVLLPLTFSKVPPSPGSYDQACTLLEQVGLSGKEKSFPAQLSGGQQRRVAIARAFINQPDIILADEPTGDLDEETEGEILRIFREKNQIAKTTFLVVTHNGVLGKTQHKPRTFMMKNGVLSENSSEVASSI